MSLYPIQTLETDVSKARRNFFLYIFLIILGWFSLGFFLNNENVVWALRFSLLVPIMLAIEAFISLQRKIQIELYENGIKVRGIEEVIPWDKFTCFAYPNGNNFVLYIDRGFSFFPKLKKISALSCVDKDNVPYVFYTFRFNKAYRTNDPYSFYLEVEQKRQKNDLPNGPIISLDHFLINGQPVIASPPKKIIGWVLSIILIFFGLSSLYSMNSPVFVLSEKWSNYGAKIGICLIVILTILAWKQARTYNERLSQKSLFEKILFYAVIIPSFVALFTYIPIVHGFPKAYTVTFGKMSHKTTAIKELSESKKSEKKYRNCITSDYFKQSFYEEFCFKEEHYERIKNRLFKKEKILVTFFGKESFFGQTAEKYVLVEDVIETPQFKSFMQQMKQKNND